MTRRARAGATVAALVAAVATSMVGTTAAAAAPVIEQPFSVATDNCRSGYTQGVLGWDLGPTIGGVVEVSGVVADQQAAPCRPADPRFTEASFRAYRGNGIVATRTVRADDMAVRFAFNLTSTVGIDRVAVQVCRRLPNFTDPSMCADAVYSRPAANQP